MIEAIRVGLGDAGGPVRDLQHRLALAGHGVQDVAPGVFDANTEASVRAFQVARGLRADGVCGQETWTALIESGWSPGDRLLCHRAPMLRGDDVGILQRRLNLLGFDAGREDGIFGPATARALVEFQRNAGLSPDGICGPTTLAALDKLSRFDDGSVAAVRERALLRADMGGLDGRRIYLAVEPGLEVLSAAIRNGLAACGASVLVNASGESDSVLAATANEADAQLLLALRLGEVHGCSCDFYETTNFRSERGRAVAAQILAEVSSILDCPCTLRGRAYAVLRESRMPAVVCQPAEAGNHSSVLRLVERTHELATAIVRGVERAHMEGVDGLAASVH